MAGLDNVDEFDDFPGGAGKIHAEEDTACDVDGDAAKGWCEIRFTGRECCDAVGGDFRDGFFPSVVLAAVEGGLDGFPDL